ncbi:hypothetical protein C8Q74DRAFT_134188 [Fomes fomentarius]|nr:hypothetical protein C8Q74DRAFT_134188 [Fomes fomentarius]
MSAPFDLEAHLRWKAGVILCSLGITGTIFGVATGQVASYFHHYWREDRCMLRTAVWAVWTLDCLQMALYSYAVVHYLVYAHNDLVGQSKIAWTASGQTAVNATLVALVQLFYVLRVSALCRYTAVTVSLLLLVVASWALSILLVVKLASTESVAALSGLEEHVVLNNSLIAATDIAISLTLVALLITSRTGGSRTKRLINRLIFYTINTGLMTSVLALLAVVTNLTKGDTMLYVLFSYVGTSLYTVSMVASLNAREGLRNHMAEVTGMTTIPTIASLRGDGNITVMDMHNSRNRAVRIPPAVFIETSVETAH